VLELETNYTNVIMNWVAAYFSRMGRQCRSNLPVCVKDINYFSTWYGHLVMYIVTSLCRSTVMYGEEEKNNFFFQTVYFLYTAILSHRLDIQSEHKVFPWLQTFITRKLHGIQTYFLPLLKLVSKILCHVMSCLKKVCIPRSFLVINVCNQGKILCLPCIYKEI
jgi:hypothetical protein